MSENAWEHGDPRMRGERVVNAVGILMSVDREGPAPRRGLGLCSVLLENKQTEEVGR